MKDKPTPPEKTEKEKPESAPGEKADLFRNKGIDLDKIERETLDEIEREFGEDFNLDDDDPISLRPDPSVLFEFGPDEPPGDPLQFTDEEIEFVVERLKEIEHLTPKEIEQKLIEAGYRGQVKARRAGAVLAYRHIQRLRRTFIEKLPPEELPQREHYLFLGSTGCGKTYLIELLFRDILKMPTVIADATRFTESGYIGDDVQMLISQLFELAGQNRAWAACGVVCVDEFDKLATSRSSARFAGEGTTKDVSGFGVQRGLLTLLSGQSTTFATDFGFSGHGAQCVMPLSNIIFIACGAFSGLNGVAEATGNDEARIGFDGKAKITVEEDIAAKFGNELLENTTAFSKFGMLPELIGRFSRLVGFQPLGKDVLRDILDDTLLRSYEREFTQEGVGLKISEEVVDHIINAAHKRQTGARGLRATLVPFLEEAAFESFGKKGGKVTIGMRDGEITVDMST